jgi:hypothetical protein
MQMKMKVGIGLMALGVVVWTAWTGWKRTRRVGPVDVAVTLAAGQSVTRSFTLNYDGRYLIEVATEKTDAAEAELKELRAEWRVWSGPREVMNGSTAEAHSIPQRSSGLTRVIGEFNGRAAQTYQLQVRFLEDAPELAAAKPRLKVVVSGLATENLNAASVLMFSIVFICELFGLILLGVAIWAKTRSPSGIKTR